MQIAFLLIFGVPISISDFTRHIIPNRVLLVFAGSTLVFLVIRDTFVVNVAFAMKVLLFLAIFQWMTAGVMGMGDAKYILLLAFLLGSAPLFYRGLFFSFLGAGAICLIYVIVNRSFNIDIPLAPAFTLGFLLACAL